MKDLPDDVHKRVNGKLFVSLTRVPDGKNVVMSEFSSKEHVLQVNFFKLIVEKHSSKTCTYVIYYNFKNIYKSLQTIN